MVPLTTRAEFIAQGRDPVIGGADELVDIILEAVGLAAPADPIAFLDAAFSTAYLRMRREAGRAAA